MPSIQSCRSLSYPESAESLNAAHISILCSLVYLNTQTLLAFLFHLLPNSSRAPQLRRARRNPPWFNGWAEPGVSGWSLSASCFQTNVQLTRRRSACVFRWSCGVCAIPSCSSPASRSWRCNRVRAGCSWSSSTPPPQACLLSVPISLCWFGTHRARMHLWQVAKHPLYVHVYTVCTFKH